ncbi:hypothetical protein BN7_3376 [Wickerhamomyces ciferrii]|uniref:Uncharacterized protein n=1 Tax=Wickerhamomyces ciferrii (strain ATCC 14091 / BCRC 22168 / CBS 111 / JCM 3599 / NBRC 0793 / NRRL Y-1031 F-60-10) TaxID=1206466 RepID=K0KNT0_WICCF|nr:uncharacterized protein BN7_3376 [Wickerhamomyces ciferrii]CCH43822.1 hypothetical protein BN7_3376 [Wickerhamomyces ciferrii]
MQATQQVNSFNSVSGQYLYSNDNSPFSKLDEKIPRSTSLDINETSLQLLDEIDPTFWSLETFLKAADQFMYYRELSFPQLVKSYTASLCLQSFHKNDHYYDKSLLFEVPYNVIQDLLYQSHVHLEQLKTTGSKIKYRKINDVKDSLVKLGNLLNQINGSSPSAEASEYYQSRHWPNESSISNVVHFVQQYNELFPLRKKGERATTCLENLNNELEHVCKVYFGSTYNTTSFNYFGGNFNSFVFNIYGEVQKWYSGYSGTPTTPRKRSIDLVVDFEVQDGNLALGDASTILFNSSPIVRKKSEIRKRRRFSVA